MDNHKQWFCKYKKFYTYFGTETKFAYFFYIKLYKLFSLLFSLPSPFRSAVLTLVPHRC